MNTWMRPRKRGGNLPGGCHPSKKAFQNLEEIVRDYIVNRRPDAREELKYFADQPDLRNAIRVAALATNKNGKRHRHQRRIPLGLLEEFRRGLLRRRESLRSCRTFPELMEITESAAAGIWKNSKLTVYDTTHRIGAHLGREPNRVYLHAGAKEGAKALGFKGSLPFILRRELPKAFRRLKPYEIEDCLCAYKDAVKLLRHEEAGRAK